MLVIPNKRIGSCPSGYPEVGPFFTTSQHGRLVAMLGSLRLIRAKLSEAGADLPSFIVVRIALETFSYLREEERSAPPTLSKRFFQVASDPASLEALLGPTIGGGLRESCARNAQRIAEASDTLWGHGELLPEKFQSCFDDARPREEDPLGCHGDEIRSLLQRWQTHFRVFFFCVGSVAMSLSDDTTDVDLLVCNRDASCEGDDVDLLKRIYEVIENDEDFSDSKLVTKTRIPVLKFSYMGRDFDLCSDRKAQSDVEATSFWRNLFLLSGVVSDRSTDDLFGDLEDLEKVPRSKRAVATLEDEISEMKGLLRNTRSGAVDKPAAAAKGGAGAGGKKKAPKFDRP